MYCEIVYFIEENNCEKRHADLKPRGYNCFWIDPIGTCNTGLHEAPLAGRTEAFDHLSRFIASQKPLRTQLMPSCLQWQLVQYQYYELATTKDRGWYKYKAWHAWTFMNFQALLLFEQGAVVSYACSAVNKSIALSVESSLQDTLRLLTVRFDNGYLSEVYETLAGGLKTVDIDTMLQVIPQLIARIDPSCRLVRKLIHDLLTAIGKQHPQVLEGSVSSNQKCLALSKADLPSSEHHGYSVVLCDRTTRPPPKEWEVAMWTTVMQGTQEAAIVMLASHLATSSSFVHSILLAYPLATMCGLMLICRRDIGIFLEAVSGWEASAASGHAEESYCTMQQNLSNSTNRRAITKPGSGHGSHAGGGGSRRSGGGGTGANTVAVLLLLLLLLVAVRAALLLVAVGAALLLLLLLLLVAVRAALLLVAVRSALLLVAVRAALLLVVVRAALLLVAVRAALLLLAVGAALLLLAADSRGAALHLTESIETKCKDLVFTFFVLSKQSALFGR
eukprot:Em0006g1097a